MIVYNKKNIEKDNKGSHYTPTYLFYNDNNELIGSFTIYGNEIWNFVIDLEYRNQGYGTQMMKELLQEVGSKKKSLSLYVLRHNRVALKVYRRCGFVITDEYPESDDGYVFKMKWENPNYIRRY